MARAADALRFRRRRTAEAVHGTRSIRTAPFETAPLDGPLASMSARRRCGRGRLRRRLSGRCSRLASRWSCLPLPPDATSSAAASSADLRSICATNAISRAYNRAGTMNVLCSWTCRHPTVGRRRGTTRLLKRCNIAVASAHYNLSNPQVSPPLLRRVPWRGVPRVLDDGERRRRPVLQACSGRGHISDRSRVIG